MARIGRPLKFSSAKELEDKMNEYFEKTPQADWTITGLALALDTSRETLMNYEAKDEYFDTVKKGKDLVEHSYELDLKHKGHSGSIFALKNFDWRDKTEQELTGKDGKDLIPQPIMNVQPQSENSGAS